MKQRRSDAVYGVTLAAILVALVTSISSIARADSLSTLNGVNLTLQTGGINYPAGASGGNTSAKIVALANAPSATGAGSNDGVTWFPITMPSSAFWQGLAWSGTTWSAVAGSNSTTAASATNGVTWSAATMSASASWVSEAWNGSVFCATTLFGNTVSSSPDGVTWTSHTVTGLSASAAMQGIAWNGTKFAILGQAGGVNAAATSADCATWALATIPGTPTGEDWRSVAWNGTTFCAVGTNTSDSAVSAAGTTWSINVAAAIASNSVASNGTSFCAMGTSGNTATTTNCTAWTTHASVLPSEFGGSVTWTGSQYVATGSSLAATSTDCVTWTTHALPATDSWFVVVGHL